LQASTGAIAPPLTPPQQPRRSRKAIASLLLGLFPFIFVPVLTVLVTLTSIFEVSILRSLVLSFFWIIPVTGLLAVIFGHQARGSIRRSAGRLRGQGIAIAGLSSGYLVLLASLFVVYVSLQPSRIIGDGTSAVGSLRTINTAAISYAGTYKRGFPPNLAVLAPPKNASIERSEKAAGLIDDVLASGVSCFGGCYRFSYIAGRVDSDGKISTYTVHADPVEHRAKSKIHYFTDQTGVIRQEENREAYQYSPPIAGQ
jgi:hypothetical protein